MKKFTSILATIMLAVMSLTFVSCDDDSYIADSLWGVWEGDMYVTSQWNGQTYYSSYSVLAFDKDPYEYASGSGYWIDYYSNAPWDYFASHIRWQVNNRNIEIYSIEDDTYFTIYDYSLSRSWFSGTIIGEYGDPMQFSLRKTSSPNWGDYDWGWDYSYPGYAPSTRADGNNNADKPVRKFMKKPTE
ncbi:putative uncharacterized protein [Prevotella sp. CAG:1185]|nr:putative uncharacterized protein [Prevotella sp. CAG:1185]